MTILYKYIIGLLFLIAIGGGFYYLTHKIKVLEADVSVKANNIKSMERGMLLYKDKNNVLHTQTIQMQSSIAELEYSKDSVTHALLDSVKRWKISKSTITQIGQIKQEVDNTKTIKYLPGKIIQKDTTYDFSIPPYTTNTVRLTRDSAVNHLKVEDVLSLAFHDHKETINPPKKFFLFRLFQKKQFVSEVDVVHQNTIIHTTGQKFIHIIK